MKEMYGNTDTTLFDKFTEVLMEKSGYHATLKEIKEVLEDDNSEKIERITELINSAIK